MKKPVFDEKDEMVDGIIEAREERIEKLAKLTKRARREVALRIRY